MHAVVEITSVLYVYWMLRYWTLSETGESKFRGKAGADEGRVVGHKGKKIPAPHVHMDYKTASGISPLS